MAFDYMPGWAKVAGALIKAPEIANDYMGLWKGVQDMRDVGNTSDALKRLEQFKTSQEAAQYQPEGYLSPDSRLRLNKLRQERTGELQRQEAAPIAADAAYLNRLAATDPTIGSEEGLRDFAERPEFWLKGSNGDPRNPYIGQTIRDFSQGNQDVLNTFRGSQGDRMALARLATNKDLANSFKDVAGGAKSYADIDADTAARTAQDQLNSIVAEYPLTQSVESWNGLTRKLRSIKGADPKIIDSMLKDIAARNSGPVGAPVTQTIKAGPNTTRGSVSLDMFRRPVEGTRVTVTDNPSDRELGLVPGKGGGAGGEATANVSWVDQNGQPQASVVLRSELPLLKSKLQAQGVTRLNIVEGKRASRTEMLAKEGRPKGLSGLKRPGGAPSGKGGYTFKDGRLVPNQ